MRREWDPDCGHVLILCAPGDTLAKRFDDAVYHSRKQREIFDEFSATFDAAQIRTWTRMVEAWNADTSCPDPFQEPDPGTFFVLRKVRNC